MKEEIELHMNDIECSTNLSNSLYSLNKTKFRFLCQNDLPEVKKLCHQWFPIEYPDDWYADITSNPRFYALAACFNNKIMGLLIAETKNLSKMNKEDQEILPFTCGKTVEIGYILTLGVNEELRRSGIASLLLDHYLHHLSIHEANRIKAILLHVLTTNSSAIMFYEKRSFMRHSFLPYYYTIDGKPHDGFSYVRYVNGGHAPRTALDYLERILTSLSLLDVVVWPLKILAKFFTLVGQQTASTVAYKLF